MRKKSFFVLFITLFVLCPLAYAQKTIYFSDSVYVSGENLITESIVLNNTVIFGGTTIMDGTSPYLACYNASGQKMWKTSDSVRSANPFQLKNFVNGDDGYIYTISSGTINDDSYYELWKVRTSDGKVMWKRDYPGSTVSYSFPELANKDSNTLALGTIDYDGSSYWHSLRLVKKSSGDTFQTIKMGGYTTYGIGVSKNGNIFYSHQNILFKTDSTDPGKIIWSKSYKFSYRDSIYSFEKIFFSQSGKLFAIADEVVPGYTGQLLMEIDPATGQIIWKNGQFISDEGISAIKEDKDYLYILCGHSYVGGTASYYRCMKINIKDGSIAWNVPHDLTGNGIPAVYSNKGNQSAAVDLTVDSTGNIYLTGYYKDANYGPANYGILKIKGSDGSEISEIDITLDSTRVDEYSSGYIACTLNNIPTFVGLNQPKGKLILPSFITLTQLDSSGKITLFKTLGSFYKSPSSAIQARRNRKGQIVVLRQLGPTAMLTAYDSSMHIVWNTVLPKRSFGHMALRMASSKTGQICVVSEGVSLQSTPPHYAVNNDSLYMTLFSDNGQLLKIHSMCQTCSPNTSLNRYPVNLYGDSTEFYFTYSNIIIRIDTSSYLVANNSNGYWSSPQGDVFASYNSSDMLHIDAYGLSELDKKSLAGHGFVYTPKNDHYRHVIRLNNQVFLCGYSNVMVCYNIPAMDTVWKKYYGNQLGDFTKMVTDSNGYLYAVGTSYYNKINNTYDISIRKIEASTGKLIWTYIYTSPLQTSDPTDIWYDKINKTISVCGYEKSSGLVNNRPIAITLTRNGKLLALYEPKPIVESDSRATSITGDGKYVYITGNTILSDNLQNGFLTAIQPDTLVPQAAFTSLGACVHSPVHFINRSINGSAYSWDFGDGSAISTSASPTHTYSTIGTYYITLKVTSTNSRVDSIMDSITIVADCVWPGDANADKKVDLTDLLSIGVAYGKTGPKRTNASLNWEGQYSANWSKSFLSGVNYKHADCNGDSIIDSKDTLAIRLNFSQTHLKRMEINQAEATDPLLYLKARSNKLNKGDTLIEDIFLGTSDIPANNIYGLAFNVSFDNSIFDASAARIDVGSSWIKNDSIPFLEMDKHVSGEIDMAMVRTDGRNQSGYGRIATLYIPVKESITARQALLLSNNLVIDNNGKSLPLNLQNDTVSIPTSIGGMSASQEGITLYPNPFNGSTTVSYSLRQSGQVSITIRDITGRNIETVNKFSPEGSNKLRIDGLGKGIYFLEINVNGDKKVLKMISL